MDRSIIIPVFLLLALSAVAAGLQVVPEPSDPVRVEAGPPAPDTGVLPATKRFLGSYGSTQQYPVSDGDGTSLGLHGWRTFHIGGNCCEHYLATTPAGAVVNLGGTYPTWSEDGGATWWRATTHNPMLGAEGAVVAAPGGDIVGMTWDPYTGDQVVSFRYDNATDTWHYDLVNLKTAFFDRPWLSIAPGPFFQDGVEIPYVTFMRGGLAKFPQYMSLDGLHYTSIEHTYAAFAANAATLGGVTTIDALPDFGVTHEVDHYNPHPSALGHPLPRGGYMAPIPNTNHTQYHWAVLDQDLTWKALTLDLPKGDLFFDDHGGIHHIDLYGTAWIFHRYSADGGKTWTEQVYKGEGRSVAHWSFALDSERETAVLLVHWKEATVDRDLAYRIRDYGTSLAPDEILQVGNGDMRFGRGLLASSSRLDFNSVGILPDGRIAAVFGDRWHQPGFAIEAPGQEVLSMPLGLR